MPYVTQITDPYDRTDLPNHGELGGLLRNDHPQYLLEEDYLIDYATLASGIADNTALIITVSGVLQTQIDNNTLLITTTSGWVVDNYVSNDTMTTISGDIVDQIPTDYYTQGQITTISGDIVAQIPTDFYTQSEVDTISGALDAAKSDVGHTHTESDITDLGDYVTTSGMTTISGDIVAQIPSDYVSDSEMTTISGDIVDQIPTDYYTQGEVTTISGDIVAQIVGGDGTIGDVDLSTNMSYYTMTTSVVSGTVSGTVSFGDTLYLQSDFTYAATDADSASTAPAYVMALASGTGGMDLLRKGDVRLDSWSWSGGKIYLSTTTGAMTQTKPTGTGDQVVICGYATTADTMLFDPNLMQITVA